jgi:hypothetical protein
MQYLDCGSPDGEIAFAWETANTLALEFKLDLSLVSSMMFMLRAFLPRSILAKDVILIPLGTGCTFDVP